MKNNLIEQIKSIIRGKWSEMNADEYQRKQDATKQHNEEVNVTKKTVGTVTGLHSLIHEEEDKHNLLKNPNVLSIC